MVYKVEVDVDKLIKENSSKRMEIMKELCEGHYSNEITLKLVDDLRYFTLIIKELEKMKEGNDIRKP